MSCGITNQIQTKNNANKFSNIACTSAFDSEHIHSKEMQFWSRRQKYNTIQTKCEYSGELLNIQN